MKHDLAMIRQSPLLCQLCGCLVSKPCQIGGSACTQALEMAELCATEVSRERARGDVVSAQGWVAMCIHYANLVLGEPS